MHRCCVLLCYVILCYVLNILAHTPHLTGQNVEHRLVRKPSTKVQVWLVLLYLLAPIICQGFKGGGLNFLLRDGHNKYIPLMPMLPLKIAAKPSFIW